MLYIFYFTFYLIKTLNGCFVKGDGGVARGIKNPAVHATYFFMKQWEGPINQRLSPYFIKLDPSNNLYLYLHIFHDIRYFVVILTHEKSLNTYSQHLQPAKSTAISVLHIDKKKTE